MGSNGLVKTAGTNRVVVAFNVSGSKHVRMAKPVRVIASH
jgi:hypothetical protein